MKLYIWEFIWKYFKVFNFHLSFLSVYSCTDEFKPFALSPNYLNIKAQSRRYTLWDCLRITTEWSSVLVIYYYFFLLFVFHIAELPVELYFWPTIKSERWKMWRGKKKTFHGSYLSTYQVEKNKSRTIVLFTVLLPPLLILLYIILLMW